MPRVSSFHCVTHSAEETKKWGAKIAKSLREGDAVVFLADLGAGKTTFVQGMVKGLGIREEALSPTFVMAQTLAGRINVHHLDFYRLTAKEILDLGLQDYVTGKGEVGPGLVLMEWADRCKQIWPKERLEVRIKILPKSTSRKISIKGIGPRFAQMAARWTAS